MTTSAKEITCRCKAYPFPHRFMSGNCDGWTAVEKAWADQKACDECRYCQHNPGMSDEPPSRECNLLENKRRYDPVGCPGLDYILTEKS